MDRQWRDGDEAFGALMQKFGQRSVQVFAKLDEMTPGDHMSKGEEGFVLLSMVIAQFSHVSRASIDDILPQMTRLAKLVKKQTVYEAVDPSDPRCNTATPLSADN